jgi:hypothetical protein
MNYGTLLPDDFCDANTLQVRPMQLFKNIQMALFVLKEVFNFITESIWKEQQHHAQSREILHVSQRLLLCELGDQHNDIDGW